MQAQVGEPIPSAPSLRRGTIAATQRVAAVLRDRGFEARVRRMEWDDVPVCLIVLEGFDDVRIYAHCSEDEPDSSWRLVAAVEGAELADVELRELTRTSLAIMVAKRLIPFLSMTRGELLRLA